VEHGREGRVCDWISQEYNTDRHLICNTLGGDRPLMHCNRDDDLYRCREIYAGKNMPEKTEYHAGIASVTKAHLLMAP